VSYSTLERAATPNRNSVVMPFLKWAGGKRQLVPQLLNHLPPRYNRYYEPFVGAGALLMTLQPKRATINDSNEELINCYKVIKYQVDDLIHDLHTHQNHADYFYQIRAWDRHQDFASKSHVQRASRVIFLNKTCYNGLFRVNSRGEFNAPFGRYKRPNIVDQTVLRAVSDYFNRSDLTILNQDFAQAVADAEAGDFIYFDPPYDPLSETASFTAYGANGFNREEQKRLKAVVDALDQKGCKIMLSNACTDFICDLYQGYRQERVQAARAINSNALKRGKIDEILVMNY
jgi:DNA adenine methylase